MTSPVVQPTFPTTGPYTVTRNDLQAHSDGINDLYRIANNNELEIFDSGQGTVVQPSTWTMVGFRLAQSSITYSSGGAGLTKVTDGIKVDNAGWYECWSSFSWPISPNAGNRRLLGISRSTGSPGKIRQDYTTTALGSTLLVQVQGRESFPAGSIIGLWVFHDAAAAITVNGPARLSVRQVS